MTKHLFVFLSISLMLTLSGCVGRYPVNDGVSEYSVYGKRYKVLKSAKNYHEAGYATWYGAKFNRHHTSSGERYNMYRMTAAHKTLPLYTKVKVTNLENGRQVIVRINDRGPFVSNRLIDLSYAAAKQLKILGRGIARVDVKAI